MRTLGISPKVLAPLEVAAAAAVGALAATGTVPAEIRAALAVSAVGALFAYLRGPGAVIDDELEPDPEARLAADDPDPGEDPKLEEAA